MNQPRLDMRDIARSGHVTRWHSVRTSRPQTLAEHHFMVAVITDHLLQAILDKDQMAAADRLGLLRYALHHDAPELLTGDLPSPLKRRIEAATGKDNPIDQIEAEIAPWLIEMKNRVKSNPAWVAIVKLADLIDAIVFISQEGIGHHAEAVKKGLQEQFSARLDAAKETAAGQWDEALVLLDLMLDGAGNQIAFEI